MMQFLELPGEPVGPDKVDVAPGLSFGTALANGRTTTRGWSSAAGAAGSESVVFEVDVELGQIRTHPIQHCERLVAAFPRDDATTPGSPGPSRGTPLRAPHPTSAPGIAPLALPIRRAVSRPEETWTAARFIERIREWLALTAKGKLHQDDQPLEPLFAANHIVLPDDFSTNERDLSQRLRIEPIRYPAGSSSVILEGRFRPNSRSGDPADGGKKASPLSS